MAYTCPCRARAHYDVIRLLGLFVEELHGREFDHLLNQRTYLVGLCVPFTQSRNHYSFLFLVDGSRPQTCFNEIEVVHVEKN